MNQQLNKGFTLVEALVALLVLSIGLLGVAALQLTALQNNNNAMFRSQATYFAYDIVDRMRANRTQALSNQYQIAFDQGMLDEGEACTGTVEACDINAWKQMLRATLPSGEGSIDTNGATGEATIRIRWDDTKAGPGEDAERLVFVTRTRI